MANKLNVTVIGAQSPMLIKSTTMAIKIHGDSVTLESWYRMFMKPVNDSKNLASNLLNGLMMDV